MLKHDCKECGKRLSEAAATCPNCGAPKPPDGWRQIKLQARPFAIAALVFLLLVATYGLFSGRKPVTGDSTPSIAAASVVKPDATTETDHASRNLPTPASAIKPGMRFDLYRGMRYDHEVTFYCNSLELEKEIVNYLHKGDKDNVKRMLSPGTSGPYYCDDRAGLDHESFEVESVIDANGQDGVVAYHRIEPSKFNHTYYTPVGFVKPWDNLIPTPINQNVTPSDVKEGMQFRIYNKDFVACRKMADLARITEYIANGDKENVQRMLNGHTSSANCFDNLAIFPDATLEVIGVHEEDGSLGPVVEFSGNRIGIYTQIKFVNPSSLTPSTAN